MTARRRTRTTHTAAQRHDPLTGLGRIALALVLALLVTIRLPDVTLGAALNAPADDPDIRQLRVQVLPEFDDPRVLVIAQGRLDVQPEALPATVTVAIPRGAQINQMATMNTDSGAIESQPFDVAPDPEDDRWTLVTYTADSAHLFYEYYDTAFAAGNPDRLFTYTLATAYPIGSLQIEVQQPRTATAFHLVPEPVIARADENLNLTYHLFDFGAVEAGDEIAIQIGYTKTDPAPSVTREELMGSTGMGQDLASQATAPADSAQGNPMLWGLGLVGVAGVAVILWRRQSGQPAAPAPPQRPPARATGGIADHRRATAAHGSQAPAAKPEQAPQGLTYCPMCGAKLRTAARFCHVCGNRLAEGTDNPVTPASD